MSGLTEILSKKLISSCAAKTKKLGRTKGWPNMCSSSILFATHLPASLTLLLCSVSLNWKLISPRSQIFFFGGKFMWLLCAGFLHIGGICNIICEAIHFTSRSAIQQKTVCEENIIFWASSWGSRWGVGGWRGHPTNMDFRLPPAPSSTDSAQPTSKRIQISSDNVKQLQNQDRGFKYYLFTNAGFLTDPDILNPSWCKGSDTW